MKAPEPAEPWTPKVLDAFEYGNTCVRPNVFFIKDNYPQSEDCLFLNIFVPGNAKSHFLGFFFLFPSYKLKIFLFLIILCYFSHSFS